MNPQLRRRAGWTVTRTPADSDEARHLLRRYCAEIVGRYYGRPASDSEVDTRHDLVAARRLYMRQGYVEIPPYSDNPYADHWFEKNLARDGAFAAGTPG
jgi:hypothetical protein